jgi:hypothetical protein
LKKNRVHYFSDEFYQKIEDKTNGLTSKEKKGMMILPQTGWMIAACLWQVEESPHSKEHDTGEFPDRGNPMDRATEKYRLATGKGAKVVQETTDRFSNVPARQPLSGARSNRSRLN